MNFEMTPQEAGHLAAFIEKLRKRIPGDPWHKPGIENALAGARHRASAPDLAIAAITAALVPTNRTPAVIGMDGPHWRETTLPPRPMSVDPAHRCSVCSEHHDRCRAKWSADHEFESVVEAQRRAADTEAVKAAVAALKEDLPPIAPPLPPRTLDQLAEANPKLHVKVDAVRAMLPAPAIQEPESGGDDETGAVA